MRSIRYPATAHAAAPTTVVLLPGAYHSPEDFLAAGFHTRVQSRGLDVDLEFVDPEMEHLRDRRSREQLHEQIVKPARSLGCRNLWLVGISLGGFMALDYAAAHPGDLDGLCLLSPYLGARWVIKEIAAAAGLAAWEGGAGPAIDEDRAIWSFIRSLAIEQAQVHAPPHTPALDLYLGYGTEDRFAAAHRLMAGALPANVSKAVIGRHDWDTWTTLWEDFLDSRLS
jgi:pimeloyl-ACP methyl ester carboxylesterase